MCFRPQAEHACARGCVHVWGMPNLPTKFIVLGRLRQTILNDLRGSAMFDNGRISVAGFDPTIVLNDFRGNIISRTLFKKLNSHSLLGQLTFMCFRFSYVQFISMFFFSSNRPRSKMFFRISPEIWHEYRMIALWFSWVLMNSASVSEFLLSYGFKVYIDSLTGSVGLHIIRILHIILQICMGSWGIHM